MNTYTWNCRTVDAYPTHTDESGNVAQKVVYTVHYRVTATKGELSTTSIGTQSLDTSDLTGFTFFEDVTHEDMIAWTKAAMGEERVAEIEASLDAQIADLESPKSVTLTISEPTPEVTADTPAE